MAFLSTSLIPNNKTSPLELAKADTVLSQLLGLLYSTFSLNSIFVLLFFHILPVSSYSCVTNYRELVLY